MPAPLQMSCMVVRWKPWRAKHTSAASRMWARAGYRVAGFSFGTGESSQGVQTKRSSVLFGSPQWQINGDLASSIVSAPDPRCEDARRRRLALQRNRFEFAGASGYCLGRTDFEGREPDDRRQARHQAGGRHRRPRLEQDAVPAEDRVPDARRPAAAGAEAARALGEDRSLRAAARRRRRARPSSSCTTARPTPTATSTSGMR